VLAGASDRSQNSSPKQRAPIQEDINKANRGRISAGKQVLDNQELIRPASKLFDREIDQALAVPSGHGVGQLTKTCAFCALRI
jgi:hypothetical protein